MTTKTRQLINAESLQASDEIITGTYETNNEQGDEVVKPIYETVAGIILKPDCVEVSECVSVSQGPCVVDYFTETIGL